MDFQIIITGLIVLLAIFYFAVTIWRKGKSFIPSPSKGCGNDCDCDN